MASIFHLAYASFLKASACGLCFVAGSLVGSFGFLAPLVAGLPLRACWRLLGWSQEPLLQEIWRAPMRLIFAALLGGVLSALCFLWGALSGHSPTFRGLSLLACNAMVFCGLAVYSFLRFQATPSKAEADEDETSQEPASQTFHTIEVDGREVMLRVFTPPPEGRGSKPAVVMVCGLLWLGEGILGFIGLNFNDAFGHALARHGLPCVQIHTPQRHIAHTRVQELALALCTPVCLVPGFRFLLLAADVLMLLTSQRDIWLLLVVVVLPGLVDAVLATSMAVPMLLLGPLGWLLTILNMLGGLVIVPFLHFAFRLAQYLLGELDLTGESRRDYLKEVEAAVAWAEEHPKTLGSDGRLVLCGYSSGGHVAALYGLEHCVAPKNGRRRFEAVILVSGIYDLRTQWEDARRFLAPVMNLLFKDIIGADTDAKRAASSPAALVQSSQQKALDPDCHWWILNARTELLGLPLLEDILFASSGLHEGLKAKGATVKRAECGHNHWLLVFGFPAFAAAFSETLKGKEGDEEEENEEDEEDEAEKDAK